MRQRVARSRELAAAGYRPAVVARIAQISRQAIYRIPRKPPPTARRSRSPADEVDAAIVAVVAVAKANPTDGYRMVWALTRRQLGRAVNRKRVLRVMREQRLIQPARASRVAVAPGSFASSGPGSFGIST